MLRKEGRLRGALWAPLDSLTLSKTCSALVHCGMDSQHPQVFSHFHYLLSINREKKGGATSGDSSIVLIGLGKQRKWGKGANSWLMAIMSQALCWILLCAYSHVTFTIILGGRNCSSFPTNEKNEVQSAQNDSCQVIQ